MQLLIVEDNRSMREALLEMTRGLPVNVRAAADCAAALREIAAEPPALVLTDPKLPDGSGLQVLQAARAARPDAVVIVMTAFASVQNAVEAMRLRALDYIAKPFTLDEIELRLTRALASLQRDETLAALEGENRDLRRRLLCDSPLLGESPALRAVLERLARAAEAPTAVLVTGESGTGKELVARELHRRSKRAAQPFVRVNCAALAPTLLESELFGHEKGAFTGAVAQRKGRFEQADGGTIFLDEIGELPLELQAKLLRVLQEKECERVGGNRTLRLDVRVIAATNRDLRARVAAGAFREDLYYRLDVIRLHLPALRERSADVPALFTHFLQEFAGEAGRPALVAAPGLLAELQRHPWPGNVRELRNAVERAVVLAPGPEITLDDLGLPAPPAGDPVSASPAAAAGDDGDDETTPPAGTPAAAPGRTLAAAVEALERSMIGDALRRHRGVKAKAASELGLKRTVLLYKLQKLGMTGA